MEWECPECGRTHPRNAPPCSRCGHMRLERTDDPREDPTPVDYGGDRSTLLTVARYVLVGVVALLVVYWAATTLLGLLG